MKNKLIIYLHEIEFVQYKQLKNKTTQQLIAMLHKLDGRIYQVNEYYKEVK